MKLDWKPHYLFPNDASHAHHNGYSILRGDTQQGRFMLGGAKYEVMPGDDDVARFNNIKDVTNFIRGDHGT